MYSIVSRTRGRLTLDAKLKYITVLQTRIEGSVTEASPADSGNRETHKTRIRWLIFRIDSYRQEFSVRRLDVSLELFSKKNSNFVSSIEQNSTKNDLFGRY